MKEELQSLVVSVSGGAASGKPGLHSVEKLSVLGAELPVRAMTSAWGLLGVGVCSRQSGFHFLQGGRRPGPPPMWGGRA